jgi:hypothetical protein
MDYVIRTKDGRYLRQYDNGHHYTGNLNAALFFKGKKDADEYALACKYRAANEGWQIVKKEASLFAE